MHSTQKKPLFEIFQFSEPFASLGCGPPGDSYMKKTGMVVENFVLSPLRRQIWSWLELYLTRTRYHFKDDCYNDFKDINNVLSKRL